MSEQDTVGTRILRIAAAHSILRLQTRKELAATFGVTYETLRKWIAGEAAPSRKRAESIAARMGVRAETFMHGVVYQVPNALSVNEPEGLYQVAQPVSPASVTSPPRSRSTTIEWRDKEMMEAHPQFCVVVPDDSMVPIMRKGMLAEFESVTEQQAVRNEDIVLVEDGAGDWYIGTFQRATASRWQVRPERGVPLESDRDGLTVLAVLIATHGRRG